MMGFITAQQAAWGALSAPFILGAYLAWGARLRRGYDFRRDTITDLGDGVDATAIFFVIVNTFIGLVLLDVRETRDLRVQR